MKYPQWSVPRQTRRKHRYDPRMREYLLRTIREMGDNILFGDLRIAVRDYLLGWP